MPMLEREEVKLVTHYVATFKGVFGRNRSVKLAVGKGQEFAHGTILADADLAKLASDYAASIKAKQGRVYVRRYPDVEVATYSDGVKMVTVKPFDALTVYAAEV